MEAQLKAALEIDTVYTLNGVVMAYFADLSGEDNYTRIDDKGAWIRALQLLDGLNLGGETLYASPSIVCSHFGVDETALCELLGFGDSSFSYCTMLWFVVKPKKRRQGDDAEDE